MLFGDLKEVAFILWTTIEVLNILLFKLAQANIFGNFLFLLFKGQNSISDILEVDNFGKFFLVGFLVLYRFVVNSYFQNLVDTIKKVAESKIPFLGICLGLQLLFERSDETPGAEGLGILRGEILRIPQKEGLKIPHMGWNSLEISPEAKLFKGIDNHAYVYFVHSYYLKASDENIVAASTEYSVHIHASVESENIFACQFHPEKSSDVGLKILQNFAQL